MPIKRKLTRKYSKRRRSLVVIIGFLLIVCLRCNRNPTGPALPEESKIAVFSVLNPNQKNQTLLKRSLTFNETSAGYAGELDVSNVSIVLSGPDSEGSGKLVAMKNILKGGH